MKNKDDNLQLRSEINSVVITDMTITIIVLVVNKVLNTICLRFKAYTLCEIIEAMSVSLASMIMLITTLFIIVITILTIIDMRNGKVEH